jgi:crotonobetainyl-CoA:carnitine CoA-transferase CaiB-like acyl-CoA transferase
MDPMDHAAQSGDHDSGESGPGLLAGVRILAFCHWLQGPAASQYLADLGADVIKIEPIGGAAERKVLGPGRGPDGASSLFVSGNRNQRSIALDLKSADGRALVMSLLQEYDIVIENFRPGVMDKLGLGYEDLRRVSPAVIYASATGYGSSGPMADKPGQDLLAQALTGLVAASGERPTAAGAAVIDQHGAALLAMAVLAAVTRRSRNGQGCLVEASLFNAGIDLQMEALTFYLNREGGAFDDVLARRGELGTWYHPAPYGIYDVADGHVAVSLVDKSLLQVALPGVLDALTLLDPVTDRDAFAAAVADALRPLSRGEVEEVLSAAGVWCAPVLTYEDVEHHPQVVHNGLIEQVGDNDWQARVVKHPVRYDGEVPPVTRNPPRIGEHTAEILEQLGYGPERIEELVAAGVVRRGASGRLQPAVS